MGELVPSDKDLPANLDRTIQVAREYAAAARAPNTLRAYRSDVDNFSTYCRVELGGAEPLPAAPETVALYIAAMASERDLKASTIQRRLASISAWHKRAGFASPTEERLVRETRYPGHSLRQEVANSTRYLSRSVTIPVAA